MLKVCMRWNLIKIRRWVKTSHTQPHIVAHTYSQACQFTTPQDELGECVFLSDGCVGFLPGLIPHSQTYLSTLYSRLTAIKQNTQNDTTSLLRLRLPPALAPIPLSLYLFGTWLSLRLISGELNTEGDNQRQVAPLVTRMYLSPDPWPRWQEVSRWPSDLPWWPFLSPCCLAGRKDAVCCPQAPLTHSSLLSSGETRLLIPGLSVFMLTFYSPFFIFSISDLLLFFCQHPLYPILTSFLYSFIISSVPLWDVSKHCGQQQTTKVPMPSWSHSRG